MKTKIAINGFGRIGRSAFRVAYSRDDIEVVAINDLANTKVLAHLLKHDTVYGSYNHKVNFDDNNLIVDDKAIRVFKQADPSLLPWGDLGVDVVIEATGQFTDSAKARTHLTAGAKKVVISAVVSGEGVDTVIIGVNEANIKDTGDILSTASCTTNCVTPVLDILAQNFGIEKAMLTTLHSYTASQRLVDAPAQDLRLARSAAQNIVPTTTNADAAVTQVLPDLNDQFAGLAVRIPTLDVSLADLVVLVKKPTSIEEINETFAKAAAEPYYQGILSVTNEELVSSDFIGNSHSAVIDLGLTKVVAGTLVKVVAWYDNEWAFCNRLVELVADAGKQLGTASIAVESNLQEVNIGQEQL